jgi:peptidoglycan/LPS O-acetylase OafA/YrhL
LGVPRAAPDSPPGGPHLAYVPALDGLRAVAVLGVLAFHGGVSWLPGGFLGVDAFFVLSGFLITSLLLREWGSTGKIALGAFWSRRARRLLPALFALVLAVVCVAPFVVPAGSYPGLRGDAISTLLYVANWHYVASGATYFAQSLPPSPLTHTWSLAIEEQFYLVWPIVVLLVLMWARRLRPLLWVCVAGAVASCVEMLAMFRAGASLTRLYYGTDTRAQSLLVGAALAGWLAMFARSRGEATGTPDAWRPRSGTARASLTVLGLVGLAGCAGMWASSPGTSPILYEGGFLLFALGAAAVIAAAVCLPTGFLSRSFGARPLRDLGRISYGVYLWHYPLFLWVDGQRTHLGGAALLGIRCVLSVGLAWISFVVLERPVRQGRVRALRGRRAWIAVPAGVTACAAAVVAATLAFPGPRLAGVAGFPPGSPGADTAPAVAHSDHTSVRVLLLGDSTALTLGLALSEDASRYGIAQRDVAILGCGVVTGRKVRLTGNVETVTRPCNSSPIPRGTPRVETVPTPYGVNVTIPDGERWTTWYRDWISRDRPQVVVILAGRWEVVTRTFRGHWTNILHPKFAHDVERGLLRTVRLATAGGASAVLMTAPCYDAGEQPDGQPWPTDAPARLEAYNHIVREVAARAGGHVSVYPLDALVCPGGAFHRILDGVTVRAPDGVHFTATAGAFLGPRIWPYVLRSAGVRPGRG